MIKRIKKERKPNDRQNKETGNQYHNTKVCVDLLKLSKEK